jgi:hypothetical protein
LSRGGSSDRHRGFAGFGTLDAVLGAAAAAFFDAGRVERATHNMIADAG